MEVSPDVEEEMQENYINTEEPPLDADNEAEAETVNPEVGEQWNKASAKQGLLSLTELVFGFLFQCCKSKTNGARITEFGTGLHLDNVWANV